MAEKIKINRAPVLTLWAAIVAERLGYDPDESLTLAKAVTGLNAQSKGRRLGIYEQQPEKKQSTKRGQPTQTEALTVDLLGRSISVKKTKDGIRAIVDGQPITPESARHYIETKFGDALPKVRQALQELAESFSEDHLRDNAYQLYEEFRPKIPEGTKGWGAKGDLDLSVVESLRGKKSSS